MGLNFVKARRGLASAALLLGSAVTPALAQDQSEPIETPSGPMVLVETEDIEVEVHVGDHVFTYPEYSGAYVLERLGDTFLLFLATGGNVCPGYYVWMETSADALMATEPFGTCSDLYKLSEEGETLVLTVPSITPGEGDIAYTWDGSETVRENQLGLPQSDTPPGADPRGWVGRHPAELLDTADWEALLLNVLTAEELEDLRYAATMSGSGGFQLIDGWVVASGFDKYSDMISAIALHPDGELLVALGERGTKNAKLWGETSHPYPAAIQEVLDGAQ